MDEDTAVIAFLLWIFCKRTLRTDRTEEAIVRVPACHANTPYEFCVYLFPLLYGTSIIGDNGIYIYIFHFLCRPKSSMLYFLYGSKGIQIHGETGACCTIHIIKVKCLAYLPVKIIEASRVLEAKMTCPIVFLLIGICYRQYTRLNILCNHEPYGVRLSLFVLPYISECHSAAKVYGAVSLHVILHHVIIGIIALSVALAYFCKP